MSRNDDNVRRLWTEDELDRALDALHTDVSTDDDVLARGRAVMLAATTTPAGKPAGPAATPATAPDGPERRLPSRWRRRSLLAAAAVVTLVAGGLVAQTLAMDEKTPGSTATADELNAAADRVTAAAAKPTGRTTATGPGKYRYIRSRSVGTTATYQQGGGTALTQGEELREFWVPATWSDVWLLRSRTTGTVPSMTERGKSVRLPGKPEEYRARCGDFFLDGGQKPCAKPGNWGDPTPDWMARLPRDPQKLYDRIRADAVRNERGNAELLVTVAEALSTGLLPADLRAALYKAIAKIPGLQVTDRTANLDGQVGIAYGMDDGITRHEVIIDQRTGQYIGHRELLAKDSEAGRAGTVLRHSSVRITEVDRLGATSR